MSIIRDEGIIIRNRQLAEADRIVTILTRKYGKVEAAARGARRPRSRFAAGTLPFTHVNFMLFEGKNLHNLSQVEIIHPFSVFRDNLLKMAYATYWVELVESLLEISQHAEDIFLLTLKAFHRLAEMEKPALLSRLFELRLADYLGWRPELNACVKCGSKVSTGPYFFAGGLGGMICPACNEREQSGVPVSDETWRVMERLLNTPESGGAGKVESTPRSQKEMAVLLCEFFQWQIGRKLKSFAFLQEVE